MPPTVGATARLAGDLDPRIALELGAKLLPRGLVDADSGDDLGAAHGAWRGREELERAWQCRFRGRLW